MNPICRVSFVYFCTCNVTYYFVLQLNQLKADLQDLLFSDKWTPDAYLIARVYVPDDFERDDKDDFTDNERYTSYNMCVSFI